MSRVSIKRFLIEIVAYVFTDVLLLFGQPQSIPVLKNGLQLLKEKAFEIIPKYGRIEARSWP